jgi:hypothetical protein
MKAFKAANISFVFSSPWSLRFMLLGSRQKKCPNLPRFEVHLQPRNAAPTALSNGGER